MKDKIKLLLILMCIFLLVGCGVKDGDKDVHYKPSEYKHNVAISNANRAVEDINREIISFGVWYIPENLVSAFIFTNWTLSVALSNSPLISVIHFKASLSSSVEGAIL